VIKIPNAVKHILVALFTLAVLFLGREYFPAIPFEYTLHNVGLLLAIVIIGSLAPDLDLVTSVLGKIVNLILLGLVIYFVIIHNYVIAIILLAMVIILHLITHKTFHHFWVGGLLSIPVFYFLGTVYGIGFLVGYFSHLIVD